MQARITEPDINEILRYLGFHGQPPAPETQMQIDACIQKVVQASLPRLVYRILPCKNGRIQGVSLPGNDILHLLQGCSGAVLMAVTVGAGVETLLMRNEVNNMSDAVVMDACAAAVVENICDNFQSDLAFSVKQQGLSVTDRFSPGYGDLPLSAQKLFLDVLNAERRIGLTVTDNYLMVPRKSITAIIGIGKNLPEHRVRGCQNCSLRENCMYRKNGEKCYG